MFDLTAKGLELEYLPKEKNHEVVLCGYDRIGYNIFEKLGDMGKSFIVVDFNPDIIRKLVKKKIPLGVHHLFLGKIVSVHVDQKILNEKGEIDFSKVSPFIYNQGEYWDLYEKIGVHGFSKR